MPLTPEDIAQIAALFDSQTQILREEFATKEELRVLRNEVQEGFDGLHKRLETLDQEYLSMREQVKRTDDHETRITSLEKKVA